MSGGLSALRPRIAAKPPPPANPAPPLVGDTGSAKLNAVADVINTTAAPFQNAPDPKRGALGVVEHDLGAVLGVVSAPFQLLDTGFAMLTAPLAAMMPAFPAATLLMPHLGTPHAHSHPLSLTPPNPVPVPLPSIGQVMLAGCVSVLIGGIPAARASDIGLAPLCFGFSPAFEIFTGSSNTWIGGSRAARVTDVTRHCNPASAMNAVGKGMGAVGVVAGAVSAGASAAAGDTLRATMQAAQAVADAAALAMSAALLGKDPGIPPSMGAIMMGNPTVLIGGFPMPDLLSLLGGLLKGLKKLGKAFSKSPKVNKALGKIGLCIAPGEPVSSFTGEIFNDFVDYEAREGGFVWARHYRSNWNEDNGPLGLGFRHFYERRLTLLRTRALYETHDGERVELPRGTDGAFVEGAGFALTSDDGQTFVLRTDRDEELEFAVMPTVPPTGRLVRYRTQRVDLGLSYDAAGRLDRLSEMAGAGPVDTVLHYDEGGRILEILRAPRGAQSQRIVGYAYHDGCLTLWQDPLGETARYAYDLQHRMVQGTDRRGYSFHWEYDARSGRCVRAYGDDGLWRIDAEYQGAEATFHEPDGGWWRYKHYPDGTVSHLLDAEGGLLAYVKDDTGQIAKQVLPGGIEYVWLYDDRGKHFGRRDPWGHVLPPEEDDPDPPSPLDHDGPRTQQAWLWGRPLCEQPKRFFALSVGARETVAQLGPIVSADAHIPEPVYDAAGRIVEQPLPDGSVERYRLDAEGNVVGHQDTNGQWSQFEIASWNLVAAEHTALGHTTRYGYTHRGNRLFVVDPNGNRTDYLPDKRHRLREVAHDGASHLRYVYNEQDALIEERDGGGALLVAHAVGPLGLHAKSELASGETYAYEYDAQGNITNASSTRHAVSLRYLGRVQLRDLRDGKGVEHEYDEDIALLSTLVFGRFLVEYDVSDPTAVKVNTPDGGEHRFWRASAGVIVRENGNGTRELTAFDWEDRLSARACWSADDAPAGPTWTTRYVYNAAGELLTASDSEQGPTFYDYDADHRLIAQHDHRGSRQYGYDAASNLVLTPEDPRVDYVQGNLLEATMHERFEYDDCRRIARRIRFDGEAIEYRYDSNDQLVEVRWSSRPEIWRAAYDGLGRRLWRELGGKRTDFYWDGDRLAVERRPTGEIRIYVYANEDALVPFMWLDYADEDASPESGLAFYLFCGPTGMPLRVEDAMGRVVWRAGAVDPYGELDLQSADIDVRLRFAGHFFDEDLHLFYNRFRDYDPRLGRYLQPDPLGHEGGTNLYAYCTNPVVDVDLRGLVHSKPKRAAARRAQSGKKKPAARSGGITKKGALKMGEVASYRDQKKKGAAIAKVDRDHIPSKAAVKRALEKQLGRKLSKSEAAKVDNNLTTAAIRTTTHRAGRTYGNKNTKNQINADSGNLRSAATSDLAAHQSNLKKDGMTQKQISKMESDIHQRNQSIGVYTTPLPLTLLN